MVVIGIKHFHDIACQVILFHRLLIVAFIKRIQLKAFHRLCIPDTQCIYDAVPIAYNGKVIGDGLYALISFLFKIASAFFVYIYVYIAAEFYFFGIFRPP